MISETSSSLSGISASVKRIETSANNTANLSTNGFKKDTVIQSEGETGGVVVHIEKSLTPGPRLPGPDGTSVEGSNVDPAEEAIGQIRVKVDIEANLEALRTAGEMEESIIDLFA